MPPAFARLLPTTSAALLCGCIVVPAAIDTYDADCQLMSRHLVLQPVQIAAIQHCSNQGCIALIVAGAATAAATAIVSGSVVIVGNAASWIERRANCVPPAAAPPT